jgi:hypothetical protein
VARPQARILLYTLEQDESDGYSAAQDTHIDLRDTVKALLGSVSPEKMEEPRGSVDTYFSAKMGIFAHV